jgi:hypothetical protein
MCFDFLYKFCLQYFSLQEELSEILLKMYIGLHVQRPSFLSGFHENWILSKDFRKTLKSQISLKSVQLEPSCSVRTDRHDEVDSRLSQPCERAKQHRPKLKYWLIT